MLLPTDHVAAATCNIPNSISNGQPADATAVMDNFNSIANCLNSAISPTDNPVAGNLPIFSSSNTISGGNLSGDCATADTLAVTCTKTNGVPFGHFATGSDAGQLTGTISVNRFNNGTNADGFHFLRGDGTWATPPSGGGGGGFGTVDVSAYTITGGPLSPPTEVTDSDFGYGFSHASANVNTNDFWFRTRAFSGDLTVIARTVIAPQSNGNNSFGIVFRESGATKFVALLNTWNNGTFCEVSKSANDGASSTGATGATSVSLSGGAVPAYLKAVYVSATNTLTMSVSTNGVQWVQLYSNTVDVTPNQVGFVQRIWGSTGPLPGGGAFKYFSDSGNGLKWNLP
jgi:hypothetical protein